MADVVVTGQQAVQPDLNYGAGYLCEGIDSRTIPCSGFLAGQVCLGGILPKSCGSDWNIGSKGCGDNIGNHGIQENICQELDETITGVCPLLAAVLGQPATSPLVSIKWANTTNNTGMVACTYNPNEFTSATQVSAFGERFGTGTPQYQQVVNVFCAKPGNGTTAVCSSSGSNSNGGGNGNGGGSGTDNLVIIGITVGVIVLVLVIVFVYYLFSRS